MSNLCLLLRDGPQGLDQAKARRMEHEKTLSQRYTIVLAAATVSSENAREPFLLLLFLRCP